MTITDNLNLIKKLARWFHENNFDPTAPRPAVGDLQDCFSELTETQCIMAWSRFRKEEINHD